MKLKAAIIDSGWSEAIPYEPPKQEKDESKEAFTKRCWEHQMAAVGCNNNNITAFIIAEDNYFQ